MIRAIQHLENKGMPFVWQILLCSLVLLAFVVPALYTNQNMVYAILMFTHPILFIGVLVAYKTHKEKSIPRLILVVGICSVIIAQNLQHLIHFGLDLPFNFSLLLKEIGILLITIFAYFHILMFEKKFHIKGFAIDYSLLILSAVFLLMLISPTLLHTIIYQLNFYQHIAIVNFIIGMTILTMSAVHYLLTRSIGLTDGVRILLTIILVIHFSLELVLRFEMIDDQLLINTLSLSVIHLAGPLALLFIFIEDLYLDYSEITPNKVGNLFKWISSSFAIIAIPVGLIIRSLSDAPPLDILIIGIANILISFVVVWRLMILIKNSNKQKENLNSLIKTNSLTKLSNYQGYLEKLAISELKNVLVVNLNIEDFKSINDLYGREFGDEVLKNFADRLNKLPEKLLVAHIHSDQFLIVFQTEKEGIKRLIHNIESHLGNSIEIQNHLVAVPFTLGASFNENLDTEKSAKQAEQALKQARTRHTSFVLYTEETSNNNIPRNEIRQILQQAVDDKYLPVHFQPIYNLHDGSLKALELLIRVNSKKHGLLQPGQFLEQAKSYALLTSLTQICIKMLAKHADDIGDTTVNLNLPPYMLKSPKLLNNFIQSFADENLSPQDYCIEITEDEMIPAQELIPAIKVLKAKGFAIAMDDFGTGYSSLDRLSVLDVDTVKIDRSILLTAESGNSTILEWAISLTKRLGVSVVVEGVETIEQLKLIKLLGADSVQGFLYSKPVSAMQLTNIPSNSNEIDIVTP